MCIFLQSSFFIPNFGPTCPFCFLGSFLDFGYLSRFHLFL
ncbi:hypothetical protein ELI_0415 [Eubacterium callanderi]|uniref:Uncharacterized protein n=1 Tax=Eubacterium callanderi TaxID=53442 RepID=E3GIE7_9FIRM|nr:hypothetical protein ELI_0415 [Eubacterium callanderi]